jgi:site-specific DNA-methyltransferase (adenine-specific)
MKLNTIYNEDCLETMKWMEDKSVDLIVTDPPYLISYKTNYRKNKNHDFCSPILGDNDENLIKDYIRECYRVLKDNTAMYMFCSFDKVDIFKQELEKYFNIKNMIIWVKNNWTAGDLKAQFGKQYEIIFLVNKGRKKFNGKRFTDVWNFDRIAGKSQLHQNEKPILLIQQCIEKHSNENDIIFDGFMGSGTTAIAAIKLHRQYIGSEMSTKCYNIINERIKQELSQPKLPLGNIQSHESVFDVF